MKKGRRLVCLGIGLGALLALALGIPSSRKQLIQVFVSESVHQGKPVSYWIEALQDPESARRQEAIEALAMLGPEANDAVPALAEIARHDNIHLRSLAIANGLGRIGPAAVPVLCELLKDRSIRTVVATTLGEIGPGAANAALALAQTLKDQNAWTRTTAANSLGKIGPDAKSAVPALKEALEDPSPSVRWEAALAIKNIDSENVLPD